MLYLPLIPMDLSEIMTFKENKKQTKVLAEINYIMNIHFLFTGMCFIETEWNWNVSIRCIENVTTNILIGVISKVTNPIISALMPNNSIVGENYRNQQSNNAVDKKTK